MIFTNNEAYLTYSRSSLICTLHAIYNTYDYTFSTSYLFLVWHSSHYLVVLSFQLKIPADCVYPLQSRITVTVGDTSDA